MIRRLFMEHLGWKLLSIVLAFVLWATLTREPELATSVTTPILFRNLPDDLDISSDIPERVQLEVRGPASRLTAQSLAQTAVMLDLTGIQPGERTFNIHDGTILQLPRGVINYRTVPSQVSLHFERLISKDVPIEPAYSGPPPRGYGIVRYEIIPPKARIRGPESDINRIQRVSTDPIDLSGVVSQTEKRVRIHIGRPKVRLESTAPVTYKVSLQIIPNKDAK
jgi:YbbR domain-containing protein